jgi:hypothetical protein
MLALRFVQISEQTAAFALYVINLLVFITVLESVYSAVRTDSLHEADCFVFKIVMCSFVVSLWAFGCVCVSTSILVHRLEVDVNNRSYVR